ncbi:Uncharacterised protein [Staphylococcus aureus]|nr:Uncharacterised protein [Staphylococcus aureus]
MSVSIRLPSNITSPLLSLDIFSGNNLIIDLLNMDLPQPDSPTIPKTSPLDNSKEIFSTVANHSLFIFNDVSKSLTSNNTLFITSPHISKPRQNRRGYITKLL